MAEADLKKRIYTVTELTRCIRVLLEDTFPSVWVEGEISDFVRHSSGHMYFSLRDKNSVLNSVLFRSAGQDIKFKIYDGLKVTCFGRIGVYDKRGQYQLYVDKMEPKGLGALQLAFEQLKERLRKEGLFDDTRKKKVPYLPYKIGVVTSPTGAAIRDILKVTRRRFQNVDIIINPVRVQGKDAELEIARAIDDFNTLEEVDVIIVGRGGGSLEDLWAFNEEVVARAIYNSRIPIISAVGHQVDTTIADFVSDLRAPTPSAAAELVIPRKEDLQERIEGILSRLKNALMGTVTMQEVRLRHLRESYVFKQPLNMVRQYGQRVDDMVKGLRLSIDHIVGRKEDFFKGILSRLKSLSPLAVLGRGYSITTIMPRDRIIKDAAAAKRGDKVKTRLERGTLVSRVESIEEHGDNDGIKI